MMSTVAERFRASKTWVGSPDESHRNVRVQGGIWSLTNEVDVRIKQLQSLFDKAEAYLDSVGLILEMRELEQEPAQRGKTGIARVCRSEHHRRAGSCAPATTGITLIGAGPVLIETA